MTDFIKNLVQLTTKWKQEPQTILSSTFADQQKDIIKQLHDDLLQKSQKLKQKKEYLITEGMNEDQIWEQIKSHIDPLKRQYSKILEEIKTKAQEIEHSQLEQDSEKSISNESGSSAEKSNNTSSNDDDSQCKKESCYNDNEKKEVDNSPSSDQKEKMPLGMELQSQNQKNENQTDREKENKEQQEKDDLERFLEMAENEDQQMKSQMLFEKEQQKSKESKKKNGNNDASNFEEEDGDEIEEEQEDDEDLGSDYEFGEDPDQMAKDFFKQPGKQEGDQLGEENENQQNLEEKLFEEKDEDIENAIFDEQREQLLENQQNQQDKNSQENQKDVVDGNLQENNGEIDRLEQKLLQSKDWQLKGEVRASDRPANSLIDEILDFKRNTKNISSYNREYTQDVEQIIKQRILDEMFDDRQKVSIEQNLKENFVPYSMEKSEKGLADIYEDEFKSMLNLPTATKDDKLRQEISGLFKEVCYKLDALSNLSFVPKQVIQMAEIKQTVPQINYEDKIPLQVSQASQKRPDEIFNPNEKKMESKQELSTQEKQSERRAKKRVRRTRLKELQRKKMLKKLEYMGQNKSDYKLLQQAKLNAKQQIKNKSQDSIKFSKSSQFFKNLQDKASTNSPSNKQNNKIKKRIKTNNNDK